MCVCVDTNTCMHCVDRYIPRRHDCMFERTRGKAGLLTRAWYPMISMFVRRAVPLFSRAFSSPAVNKLILPLPLLLLLLLLLLLWLPCSSLARLLLSPLPVASPLAFLFCAPAAVASSALVSAWSVKRNPSSYDDDDDDEDADGDDTDDDDDISISHMAPASLYRVMHASHVQKLHAAKGISQSSRKPDAEVTLMALGPVLPP